MTHACTNREALRSISLLVLPPAWSSSRERTLRARAVMLRALLEEAGGRRGQGLNSGLGELKYSKHKADVALPRLHVNQRHMLPLVWQHMCTVYLEDPHCLLFSISTHQDRKEFAPALRCIIPWSLSPPRTDGMKATFNFLTKKDLAVPF